MPRATFPPALALVFAACVGAAAASHAQTVTFRVPGCEQPLHTFRFNGVTFVQDAPLRSAGEGVYELDNAVAREGIVYVGAPGANPIPIVFDGAETFVVSGNCRQMTQAVIVGSDRNDAYRALKAEFQRLAREGQSLSRALTMRKAGTPAYDKVVADLRANDAAKTAKLAELETAGDDWLASVMAVNLYTSFANTEKPYGSELTYYINERFQYADFSEPVYEANPWVFEGYREFAKTLADARLTPEALEESITTQLDLVYNYRPVHKLALGGVIASLKAAQNPAAVAFARQYVKRYGEEEPEAAAQLEADLKRLAAFAGEGEAPAFAQMALDSSGQLGPADFKGKVLLIDFWASWCGPCRRENPNVVAMYNKHRAEGFEILGVSLDKQHGRWASAVQQDGLTWPQVSDLRGWQNAAAQLYGVRSIPATVLLDREGKIVARNLRGAALEAKVAEVLSASGEG